MSQKPTSEELLKAVRSINNPNLIMFLEEELDRVRTEMEQALEPVDVYRLQGHVKRLRWLLKILIRK
jgi:hypothetical protein